jgi:hypothetical protein
VVYIPTWLDMSLLLATFIVIALQHRLIAPKYGPILNVRFGLLVLCWVLMALTAVFNQHAGWTSIGLFLATLSCFAIAIQLQRTMPRKQQD